MINKSGHSKGTLLAIGSVLRAANLFSTCLVALVMTPFLIKSLGDRIYGMWMLVSSLFGFYDLLDLGMGKAVNRFLAREIGLKDERACNQVFNTALFTFAIIGLVSLLITVVFSFMARYFISDPAEVVIFRKFIILSGLSIALFFVMRAFSGVLESHLRYDVNVSVDFLNLLLRTTLIVVFLKKGYGLVAIGVIMLLVNVFCHMIMIIRTKRVAGYLKFSLKCFDPKQLKKFFGYSMYSFLSQISHRISHDIDNFVIAGFLGIGLVTVYSIAARLVKYFSQLLFATMGLMTPVFSQYEAVGNYDAIREKFEFISKICWCASLIIGGNILLLGKVFIFRWVGPEYGAAYALLVILVSSTMLSSTNIPGMNLAFGISRHRFPTILSLCGALTNLILSIIFVKRGMGLEGVAWGTAIPAVISGLFILPVYTCRIIHMDIRKYYLKIALPVLSLTAIYFWGAWLAERHVLAPGYGCVLACGLLNTFVCGLLAYYLILNNRERKYLHALVPSKRIREFLDNRMGRTA
ncbi:MAG: oligosaccharide flippase family protein [Candidatus Omnitrophota bacterium]|jgi:O-antigen/teichoic acid export membrane protein